MKNLKDITLAVNILSLTVGEFIREQQSKIKASDVQTKSLNSLVSYVDETAEKMLVEGLRKILPEAGFLTEEGTAGRKNEKLVWIIDPLDGTTNFIHGITPHSVSIALMEENHLNVTAVRLTSNWAGNNLDVESTTV